MHTKSHISNLSISCSRYPGNSLQLERRVVPKQHLRRILDSSSPCVDEFLDEDLAEYPVGFLAEDGAEDDGHSVVARLDVDGLLVAVVNGHDVSAFSDALWCLFARVLGGSLFQLVVF